MPLSSRMCLLEAACQHAKAIESAENQIPRTSSVLLAGEDPSQSQNPTPGSSQVPTLPGQPSFQTSTHNPFAGGSAVKRKRPVAAGAPRPAVSSSETAQANASTLESLAYLRLLVCDDQLLVRTCVRQFLQRIPGIKVVWEASTGRAGVSMAGELQPDIVLMDLSLPDLDSVIATRRILAQSPRTRVIAFAADSKAKGLRQVLAAGACGYLVKTADPQEWLDALQQIVAHKHLAGSADIGRKSKSSGGRK